MAPRQPAVWQLVLLPGRFQKSSIVSERYVKFEHICTRVIINNWGNFIFNVTFNQSSSRFNDCPLLKFFVSVPNIFEMWSKDLWHFLYVVNTFFFCFIYGIPIEFPQFAFQVLVAMLKEIFTALKFLHFITKNSNCQLVLVICLQAGAHLREGLLLVWIFGSTWFSAMRL